MLSFFVVVCYTIVIISQRDLKMTREQKLQEFKETLLKEPRTSCNFKLHDVVSFTNNYGVIFKDLKVIGFSEPDHNGNFIYLSTDCYWVPKNSRSLVHKGTPSITNYKLSKNLALNNGQKATFTHIDYWNRPNYELEDGTKCCCVNLDGTHLHTISAGEPDSPLEKLYQPK